MTVEESDVRRRLATDPQYPLGEPDPMKWAIAWRVLREKNGIDYNGEDTDGWMVGWFANCMATGEAQATGGTFLNADGMQSIIGGDFQPHPEYCR